MSETTDNSKAGGRCAPAPSYPSVESDGDGYILRLDDADNWHCLTKSEAKQLCTALLEDGPGAAKHLLKLTIG